MTGSAVLDALYRSLAGEIEALDARIRETLSAEPGPVAEMLDHVSAYPGKRLRSALVFLIGRIEGGLGDDHRMLAAVIEMIHLATLVHDDVIDGALLRRSLPSVNVRFSPQEAVLLGDIIFARAINLLARMGSEKALQLLTRAVSTICEGEITQNRMRFRPETDRRTYLGIIRAKTAVLYSAGCELAAHLAGSSTRRVEGYARYGLELGMAFQIMDDCLDIYGDEVIAGKSLGTDARSGKLTLPVIHLLERLTGAEREDVIALLRSGAVDEASVGRLRSLSVREGSRDHAVAEAHRHAEAALDGLRDELPEEDLSVLREIAAFVLRRRK